MLPRYRAPDTFQVGPQALVEEERRTVELLWVSLITAVFVLGVIAAGTITPVY